MNAKSVRESCAHHEVCKYEHCTDCRLYSPETPWSLWPTQPVTIPSPYQPNTVPLVWEYDWKKQFPIITCTTETSTTAVIPEKKSVLPQDHINPNKPNSAYRGEGEA